MTRDTFDFNEVYAHNYWDGEESLSGPGSGTFATEYLVTWLTLFRDANNIKKVLDIGCGDNFWMPDFENYLGVDVSEMAIDMAKMRRPGRLFKQANMIEHKVKSPGDLIICRLVMQHLPLADARAMLNNVRGGSKWLLATTYKDGVNTGSESAYNAFRIKLTDPPFNMPEPEEYIQDGWAYDERGVTRDNMCFLGLWRNDT